MKMGLCMTRLVSYKVVLRLWFGVAVFVKCKVLFISCKQKLPFQLLRYCSKSRISFKLGGFIEKYGEVTDSKPTSALQIFMQETRSTGSPFYIIFIGIQTNGFRFLTCYYHLKQGSAAPGTRG